MTDLQPTVLAGNAPESDGTPHASEPPDYLPVAPVVEVPLVEVPLAAAQMAPGVYAGVWPNLVLTAYTDENGSMVKVSDGIDPRTRPDNNVVDGAIMPIPEATP